MSQNAILASVIYIASLDCAVVLGAEHEPGYVVAASFAAGLLIAIFTAKRA